MSNSKSAARPAPSGESTRQSFADIAPVLDFPDFLQIQLQSYHDFLQAELVPEERDEKKGLEATFREHFPITDTRERYTLEYLHFTLEAPKHSIEECLAQGLTFALPLKAKLRLSAKEDEDEDEPEEAIQQDVYLGNLPVMTEKGTFVVNGAERVIVSQLHRSPGVFFSQSVHPNGTDLYSARVIPFRGSWIEFSTDVANVMWAYIDRKKKLPVTALLRCLGYSSDAEIVNLFDLADEEKVTTKKAFSKLVGRVLAATVTVEVKHEVIDEDTGEVLQETSEREVILPAEHELTEDDYGILKDANVETVIVRREVDEDDNTSLDMSTLLNTIKKDTTHSSDEALKHLYETLRSAEAPDVDAARALLDRLFFSDKRYDLGAVGRYRMNKRLGLSGEDTSVTLSKEDIVAIITELVKLQNGKSNVDDIDHLGNRRVRTVGEQLQSQFSLGLARMARTIKERMNLRDADKFTPQDLVNARTVSSVINTFFGTNQLSQFMDQTNPLAELTHKRRMSALGPGGLTRERAGFEVRDVHYTHYGRLCPIETPEGPNIGLISSLCTHGVVNQFGFIETPYRKVKNGKVTKQIEYLSAEDEDRYTIAQANAPLNEDGTYANELIRARIGGDVPLVTADQIDYMDVAPNQIISPAASLIPFLEHDDANRALMGSNMQRQAVPLLQPSAPYVGTGLEGRIARDSRAILVAEGDGVVEYVDATKITVRYDETPEDADAAFEEPVRTYSLIKFRRTNQDTNVTQKPRVAVGMKVKKGDLLADGASTERGELALGKNVLVAFMPWKGYNFEDAIVISEKVVKQDIFTSVHIEEFDHQVRDTKRGEEELTREIPNVSEEATKDLDERGIVRVGAEINPGDIIVGKITPKGETDPTPEEKLLRAIFGDKAGDVKDASLKAKPGMNGVVIDTMLFSRRKTDAITKKAEEKRLEEIQRQLGREVEALQQSFYERFFQLIGAKKAGSAIELRDGTVVVSEGGKLNKTAFKEIEPADLKIRQAYTNDDETNRQAWKLLANYQRRHQEVTGAAEQEEYRIQMGDELPPGIVQLAKVYVAKKRKLQVGDKMAGRHGNKGVVAKIVPEEDMPFLEDGTPVDICLNPLGVPSRMNLGQIFETLLGWAGDKLGETYATPAFDGASMDDIAAKLREAGLPEDGRVQLFDGQTGKAFDQKTTVGQIYMLKLSHLVDDKIHARSIGPYSLITQQPLGGKAQFGGQRFGEMEVWALYAYGASNVLRELLTVKSDDVQGRSKAYEAIVKGDNLPEPNVPESFNVLLREMQGLGLEVKID
ncbi:DNA-directed RNA polymerase subunit beta [Rubrivirga sp. SAORIC476]|uniref:DNA-directed RNA polymerase subunit beta n=1 Tax=Rubrivirga sp. SAORIC476 TaxID=1961794 RepID=UPI000BA8FC98|nr:DNA-directed RNA polymerase subunit beta [Rubrivirga sp. SAORIC476]PAP82504.1 DNA-directed RNA polymerase subunit beta [Rubrivirga sp. SAORIC476]